MVCGEGATGLGWEPEMGHGEGPEWGDALQATAPGCLGRAEVAAALGAAWLCREAPMPLVLPHRRPGDSNSLQVLPASLCART